LNERTSYFEILKSTFMVDTIPTFILIVNAFSWYFPLYIFLRNSLINLMLTYKELLIVFGLHYSAVLLSSVIGTALIEKLLCRDKILSLWMFLGGIFSFSMLFLEIESLPITFIVSILVGIALGFGYPSCLAYFADSINIENKGKMGGIMFSTALFLTFLIGFLTSMFGFVESVILYTTWRILGFLIFQLVKDKKSISKRKIVGTTYKNILSERQFILYIIPWTMFCLVNFFAGSLQEQHWSNDVFNFVVIVEFGIASIASLIGGYFADNLGRKKVIILGYLLLGIGYALLSIFPFNEVAIGIYATFDGIAWGLFFLMFLLVIWGDIASSRGKEKYYLLGALPFLISSYIWVMVIPFAKIISISASFSLASFFLFLAVVPLMFAPETLPEKKIKERELKKYIEKAKKVREKYG